MPTVKHVSLDFINQCRLCQTCEVEEYVDKQELCMYSCKICTRGGHSQAAAMIVVPNQYGWHSQKDTECMVFT